SLPAYHGLLAAAAVLTVMTIVYAIGAPLTGWLARTSALGFLPADIAADDLKRSAALRDISNLIAGQAAMGAVTPALQEAADAYARVRSASSWSMLGICVALAVGTLALILS